jgi:hypothetical protein
MTAYFAYTLILKMEVIFSTETSENFNRTQNFSVFTVTSLRTSTPTYTSKFLNTCKQAFIHPKMGTRPYLLLDVVSNVLDASSLNYSIETDYPVKVGRVS